METTQLGKYNTFYVIEFLLKCQVFSDTTGPEDSFQASGWWRERKFT